MKIEYLNNGSSDCPLIRIYNFSKNELVNFNTIILKLSNDVLKSVDTNEIESIQFIDNIKLYLKVGNNIGINEVISKEFYCILNQKKWKLIHEKITELIYKDNWNNIHIWLDETSNVSLLLTYSGKW